MGLGIGTTGVVRIAVFLIVTVSLIQLTLLFLLYMTGHRAGSAALAYQGVKTENRGGKRKKRSKEEILAASAGDWTHPDALGQFNVKIERSLQAMGGDDVFIHQQGEDEMNVTDEFGEFI